MHKSATKCNETIGKWCKNKHGASKIIYTFETYQAAPSYLGFLAAARDGAEMEARAEEWPRRPLHLPRVQSEAQMCRRLAASRNGILVVRCSRAGRPPSPDVIAQAWVPLSVLELGRRSTTLGMEERTPRMSSRLTGSIMHTKTWLLYVQLLHGWRKF
jgi:hypothetical protein